MAANEWKEHPIRSAICTLLSLLLIGWWFKGDDLGFNSHDAEVMVTAQQNWFVGESKQCASVPMPKADDHHRFGYALTDLQCDDGAPHLMKVTFWGREEQPAYDLVMWKCRRDEKEFTCKELSGVKKERPLLDPPPPQ
jgi:hypothetical protein